MLAAELRAMGVVGAGGGGFPTGVKAGSRVEYVLANGAECEPLVHKDLEIMKAFPAEVVEGLRLMMASTGARRGFFGVKEKNRLAVEALRPHLEGHPIEFTLMGDFYPAGDEYELVHLATGRLIPPAGIPLHVGCVVNNVETLFNVSQARLGRPVIEKFISVAGAVAEPSCFRVPLGTAFRDLVAMAGGATRPEVGSFVGGLMMGRLTFDLDEVVTRTTAALILLPADHPAVRRRARPAESMHRIGKSACDQCSYCTELCPRYLLGYEVMPHAVMRSLGFTATGAPQWNQWASLCCACGLCTLYSCPEGLYPKEACDRAKADLQAAGIRFEQRAPVRVHPLKEGRRVPLELLRRRLKVEEWEADTPLRDLPFLPRRVRLPLSQHVGSPAVPVVTEGQRVQAGQCVARVPEGELGADLHASLAGTIRRVGDTFLEIEA